jgi:hypothetical protein
MSEGGEHSFGHEYEARTAEANQKAQEAALELAKFREPRLLTQEQMYRIAEKLKAYFVLPAGRGTDGTASAVIRAKVRESRQQRQLGRSRCLLKRWRP